MHETIMAISVGVAKAEASAIYERPTGNMVEKKKKISFHYFNFD